MAGMTNLIEDHIFMCFERMYKEHMKVCLRYMISFSADFFFHFVMISFSHLGLTNSLDLYKCAKAFADIVIPQVSR